MLISDPGWWPGNFAELLSELGHNVTQVSTHGFERKWEKNNPGKKPNFHVVEMAPFSREDFRKAISQTKWEIILVSGDNGDSFVRMLSEKPDLLPRIPVIVAIHNHLCSLGKNPLNLLDRADGLVFLSDESWHFYVAASPSLDTKPHATIPSLYLPPQRAYPSHSSQLLQGFVNQFTKERHRGRRFDLHVAMGGSYVTANPGGISTDQQGRYNFILMAEVLAQQNVAVDIFGVFKSSVPNPKFYLDRSVRPPKPRESEEVREMYVALSDRYPNISLVGRTDKFENRLSRYDAFVLKGFVNNKCRIDQFESMNYQLRYSSSLLAGTPVIVASGTDSIVERQLADHGFGIVVNDFNSLNSVSGIRSQLRALRISENLARARRYNSIETWGDSMNKLIKSVVGHF